MSPTQSVSFFEADIKTTGASTQPCSLHVLLELVDTDTEDVHANDATTDNGVPNHERKPVAQPDIGVPSQRILKFRTVTPAEAASLGASLEHSAAVSRARTHHHDKVTNEINDVSGTVALHPLPVGGCTRVTLEVFISSLTVQLSQRAYQVPRVMREG